MTHNQDFSFVPLNNAMSCMAPEAVASTGATKSHKDERRPAEKMKRKYTKQPTDLRPVLQSPPGLSVLILCSTNCHESFSSSCRGMRIFQVSQELAFIFNNSLPLLLSFTLQVIPTCVYLMSRIAVHMEIEGTAQCPAQVMLAAALGCEELGIANKLLAQSIFGLWMTSSLLGK